MQPPYGTLSRSVLICSCMANRRPRTPRIEAFENGTPLARRSSPEFESSITRHQPPTNNDPSGKSTNNRPAARLTSSRPITALPQGQGRALAKQHHPSSQCAGLRRTKIAPAVKPTSDRSRHNRLSSEAGFPQIKIQQPLQQSWLSARQRTTTLAARSASNGSNTPLTQGQGWPSREGNSRASAISFSHYRVNPVLLQVPSPTARSIPCFCNSILPQSGQSHASAIRFSHRRVNLVLLSYPSPPAGSVPCFYNSPLPPAGSIPSFCNSFLLMSGQSRASATPFSHHRVNPVLVQFLSPSAKSIPCFCNSLLPPPSQSRASAILFSLLRVNPVLLQFLSLSIGSIPCFCKNPSSLFRANLDDFISALPSQSR
ncbi:hypothetical protein CRG98_016476 [Punica granatum]|uniref:Uncharacterized protein n=1 Tax=Punica granatum TaxID=22663 RepID=A0A2I0K3M0_PUNGR|nr:hypothetical protein CRG98_016476 [Punica granatum]